MYILSEVILYFVIAAVLFVVVYFSFDRALRSNGFQGDITDHFDGEEFYSIGQKPSKKIKKEKGERRDLFKWLFSRRRTRWVMRNITPSTPSARVEGAGVKITFVNHATFLIQTEGLNILTDPIWSKRASPFSFFGPKRYINPGINFSDLPPIDLVLLSHNHYDHLDLSTLKKLSRTLGATFLVPLGNKDYLEKRGVLVQKEMDWFDEESYKHLSIQFVPAQHFSARAISDRNKTLWGGFVIKTPSQHIYFVGDTGYGPWVETIKEKYPNGFDIALVPIGAYLPRFIMEDVHISPDEAWQIKDELNIKNAIAMHYGTFKLADDGQDEPVNRLNALSEERKDDSFVALENGQSYETKS